MEQDYKYSKEDPGCIIEQLSYVVFVLLPAREDLCGDIIRLCDVQS